MNHFGIFFTALLLAGPGLLAQDEKPREAEGQATAKQAASSLRGGDYESAREDFSSLLKASPGDEGLARGLARAWAATGGYAKALDVLKAAPKWESSTKLQAEAGRVCLRTGKLDVAEALFRRAIELDGGNVTALNRLGETLSQRGRGKAAAKIGHDVGAVYQALSFQPAAALAA
ncbi:MAG: tetratricopeptide repeat protein, partial [Planctomycetes bacterium]|nr:tetratricopeptide repeat protein [Planctomycetota bacterium]